MSNNVTRFLYKLLLLGIVLYGLDFLIGRALNHFFFTQKYGLDYRVTYSLNETKADLLIFGSSKAKHHYDPKVFEDSTHLSYYNTGREGTNILYQYAILKCILKRYQPKIIILDITRKTFSAANAGERISLLLPYYRSHPEIRDLLDSKSPFEKIKRISHIYPFNGMIYNILARNTTFLKKKGYDENDRGYVPVKKGNPDYLQSLLKDSLYTQIPYYTIDSPSVATFEKFAKDCEDANVRLYVITSPYIGTKYLADPSSQIAKSICEKHKATFIDDSFLPGISDNLDYFRDGDHLDDEGAAAFSKQIAGVIKRR